MFCYETSFLSFPTSFLTKSAQIAVFFLNICTLSLLTKRHYSVLWAARSNDRGQHAASTCAEQWYQPRH